MFLSRAAAEERDRVVKKEDIVLDGGVMARKCRLGFFFCVWVTV